MLKYLLDTNMVIYVMKRRPIEVLSQFNDNAGRMALSAITCRSFITAQKKVPKWRKTWKSLKSLRVWCRCWLTAPRHHNTTALFAAIWKKRDSQLV